MFNVRERTILFVVAGSRSYGLHTPTSDVDVKGICIPPIAQYRLGINDTFEQADSREHLAQFLEYLNNEEQEATRADCAERGLDVVGPDGQIYDIMKFFKLALNANPNILEVLFCDEGDIRIIGPAGQRIRDERDIFLSKKVVWSYQGYAFAQMKRIKSHRSWLMDPPKAMPTREQFGLPPERKLLTGDEQNAFLWVLAEILKDKVSEFRLTEQTRAELQDKIDVFGAIQSGVPDHVWPVIKDLTGATGEFIQVMQAERKYKSAVSHWKSYQDWLKTRNPKRAELERICGYDCYHPRTQFLTERGWLDYNAITDEKLATVHPLTGQVEFQKYTDRTNQECTDNLLTIETQDTKCIVTRNHRLLTSPMHRSKSNRFSTLYEERPSDWSLTPVADLVSSLRSYYHCRAAPRYGVTGRVPTGDLRTRIIEIGRYVSEGCIGKRSSDSSPREIRLSQSEDGRQERYLNILSEERATELEQDCGHLAINKRLPAWIFTQCQEALELLIDVLTDRDGTEREYSRIYYTMSPQLAMDVQAVAILSGRPSKVWGPYEGGMYQVYIGGSTRNQADTIETLVLSSTSPHVSETTGIGSVVCFTVPNGTLITRIDGKPAFHGNSKHGMHLARLMRQGKEILEKKILTVKLPKEDREWLLWIREGNMPFEELEEWFEKEQLAMKEAVEISDLPKTPNRKKADKLLIDLQMEAMRKSG